MKYKFVTLNVFVLELEHLHLAECLNVVYLFSQLFYQVKF